MTTWPRATEKVLAQIRTNVLASTTTFGPFRVPDVGASA